MADKSDPNAPRYPICKFVKDDDIDGANALLHRPPETVEEWKASINRCMVLVEGKLDDIERRVLAKKSSGG